MIDQRPPHVPGRQRNQFSPARQSPNIIDLVDSCSPQEHEYTTGWRDRMGGAKRKCLGAQDKAYKLGWEDADRSARSQMMK